MVQQQVIERCKDLTKDLQELAKKYDLPAILFVGVFAEAGQRDCYPIVLKETMRGVDTSVPPIRALNALAGYCEVTMSSVSDAHIFQYDGLGNAKTATNG